MFPQGHKGGEINIWSLNSENIPIRAIDPQRLKFHRRTIRAIDVQKVFLQSSCSKEKADRTDTYIMATKDVHSRPIYLHEICVLKSSNINSKSLNMSPKVNEHESFGVLKKKRLRKITPKYQVFKLKIDPWAKILVTSGKSHEIDIFR